MAAPKRISRERLLDSAERLFAARGFDATSTRDIASAAGDTIGTLSYHFGSKEGLLKEVVMRRFQELAEERRRLYRRYVSEAAGGKPTLNAVIRSIVLPYLERAMRGGPAWASYTCLLGRMVYVGNPIQHSAIAELTDSIAKEFIGWLQDALDDVPLIEVGYAYEFMITCMLGAGSPGEHDRLARVTGGVCKAQDFDEVSGRLVTFVEAGFASVVESRKRRRDAGRRLKAETKLSTKKPRTKRRTA